MGLWRVYASCFIHHSLIFVRLMLNFSSFFTSLYKRSTPPNPPERFDRNRRSPSNHPCSTITHRMKPVRSLYGVLFLLIIICKCPSTLRSFRPTLIPILNIFCLLWFLLIFGFLLAEWNMFTSRVSLYSNVLISVFFNFDV